MKILLVALNAKYIHSNLAVYYLKAYARSYTDQIEIAEYTINNYSDDIIQDVYKKKPDMIGFSCYIWNIELILEVAKELHKLLPNTKIWMGGPEVSYDTESLLEKAEYIEGVIVGEGEETFTELINYYTTPNSNIDEVKGIVYRKGEHIKRTEQRLPLDLNTIPFPYEKLENLQNKIIYYETSRGCPYSCSYCLSSIEKGVRLRSISLVKEELKFFLANKVPQVKFIDRTFNCNRNHALDIWKFIKENDNGVTNFHFEISADLLKEEEIELINTFRKGLIQLEIGVQSTKLETIRAIQRTMNLEQLSYAVKRINQGANTHQHLDLIAGLPYEDYTSFRNSFNEVYAMNPNQLQLGFLKVLKGSKMFFDSNQYGIVYKDKAPYEVLYTKWLSYDEVLELKKVEDMVEVYFNSGQFMNTVKFLTYFYDTPFDMYKNIGDYYETNQLSNISHTRMNRYTILLNYYRETFQCDGKEFQEILLYDLYLREKLKTRPVFAEETTVTSDLFRKFYGDESNLFRYLSGYEQFTSKQISRLTHLECFHIDVDVASRTGKIQKRDHYVLFDYRNRNPLTLDANTIVIDEI